MGNIVNITGIYIYINYTYRCICIYVLICVKIYVCECIYVYILEFSLEVAFLMEITIDTTGVYIEKLFVCVYIYVYIYLFIYVYKYV
jgi:hypothetical protein